MGSTQNASDILNLSPSLGSKTSCTANPITTGRIDTPLYSCEFPDHGGRFDRLLAFGLKIVGPKQRRLEKMNSLNHCVTDRRTHVKNAVIGSEARTVEMHKTVTLGETP